MSGIKQVAAALTALAMLTGAAMAHEVPAAGPSALVKSHAAPGRWNGGPPRMAVSRFGESEAVPRDQPGGVCDHGDNAMIC
ncbi:hypothetical protein ACQPTN_23095 [Bradyrhizobium sp. 13971]